MSDRPTGAAPPRLVAVLGPTNTGKTHLAVERMLGHASGMIGLAYGSAGRFGAGAGSNVLVEMENGWMFVTGIRDGSLMAVVTAKDADIGTIGYEIAVFAERAGDVLTPEVREELKCLMLSRA